MIDVYWIGPYVPENGGSGADLRSFHLLKGLKESGASITGAFLGRHGDEADKFFDDLKIRTSSALMKMIRSVGSGLLGTPFSYGKYYQPDLMNDVSSHDIVYVDHLHMSVHLPPEREGPVWLDEHNLEFRLWEQYARQLNVGLRQLCELEANRVFRYEMDVLELVNGFSIPSNDELTMLPGDLSDKGHQVRNGVDPRWVSDGKHRVQQPIKNIRTIGFIGKYDWRPNRHGVKQFLDGPWRSLNDQYPDLELILAGESPHRSWSKQDGVRCLGYVDRSEDFFSMIDALVVPLDVGAGTRIKVLEAMARGIPVVATERAVEGIDSIDLAAAENIDGLESLIAGYKQSPENLETIRNRAYEVVKAEYEWPGIARTLYELLLSTVDN